MKLTKSLLIAVCAILLATIVSGCGQRLDENKLLNHYNCLYHLNLLQQKFPDFIKKCEAQKLGKFSDLVSDYSKLIHQFDPDKKKIAELKAKLEEWNKDENNLSAKAYQDLKKEFLDAEEKDRVFVQVVPNANAQ